MERLKMISETLVRSGDLYLRFVEMENAPDRLLLAMKGCKRRLQIPVEMNGSTITEVFKEWNSQ